MINFFTFLLTPLSLLTSLATNTLLRLLGASADESVESVTKPELRMLLSSASESGAVEVYEQDMIEGVLDLQRTKVQQVMTPRVELVACGADSPISALLALALRYKYSRVPVYNETVDEIVGIVLTRELLNYTVTEPVQSSSATVGSIMESVTEASIFVPESMSVMNALKQMRRQRLHMLIVVDEYGGTSGIVTLEDILETLVGEIYDEDDEEEVAEDTTSIIRAADGTFTIDGMADLDLVCAKLDLEEEVDDELLAEFATLSGFLCHQVHRPAPLPALSFSARHTKSAIACRAPRATPPTLRAADAPFVFALPCCVDSRPARSQRRATSSSSATCAFRCSRPTSAG